MTTPYQKEWLLELDSILKDKCEDAIPFINPKYIVSVRIKLQGSVHQSLPYIILSMVNGDKISITFNMMNNDECKRAAELFNSLMLSW